MEGLATAAIMHAMIRALALKGDYWMKPDDAPGCRISQSSDTGQQLSYSCTIEPSDDQASRQAKVDLQSLWTVLAPGIAGHRGEPKSAFVT